MKSLGVILLLAVSCAAQIINPGGGSGGAPSGAAGGDLGSTFPNPTVIQAHWTETAITFASSPYAVVAADSVVTCDASGGNVVINLPAATGSGRQIIFKKIDSGSPTCTVTRAGSDLIDGATTYGITTQYAATALVDTVAGTWSKVSPSTPTGWSTNTGNWTTGNDNLLTTSTRTCGAATTCGLFSTSATSTATAGSDIRLSQIGGTVTGGANTGSTWATHYNETTYNVTSGTALSHGLHAIERAHFTSTAGSPISLGATGYFTLGLTNANAAAGDYQVIHAEWDSSLSGTGALTNGLATIAAGIPGAITGSPTIPYFTAFLAGDPTTVGTPGTVKCGLSVGNPGTAGTYGICIPTPSGTYTNSILTGSAPNWFSGGLLTGPLQSFHGSLSTNTKIEVAGNSTDAMIGYYNANGGLWEAGIGSSANGEFIIKDTANTVTAVYIAKSSGIVRMASNRVTLTADWTCGNSGTVSACTSATIIGSGGGVPLTFTLPSVAQSYQLECDGVVGQATAATANQWNLLTATNGVTNVTASYDMHTAAGVAAAGAVTDQASTTATFQITPSWTLGGTGTKMPFHIKASIEGTSASGTVLSLQLLAPTAADVVTIYRGATCAIR